MVAYCFAGGFHRYEACRVSRSWLRDYYTSHDLEDLITVIDGCAKVIEEVLPPILH
jgi:hypothetical protein